MLHHQVRRIIGPEGKFFREKKIMWHLKNAWPNWSTGISNRWGKVNKDNEQLWGRGQMMSIKTGHPFTGHWFENLNATHRQYTADETFVTNHRWIHVSRPCLNLPNFLMELRGGTNFTRSSEFPHASYAGTRQGACNGLNRPAMQTKPLFWESYLIDRVLTGRRACLVSTLQTYFLGMCLENESLNPSQEYCSGFVINFKANPKACIILFRL